MLRARILFIFRFLVQGLRVSGLVVLLLAAAGSPAQAQTANQRLILKDGTYQIVRQYKIVGNRVRYLSAERGDWEEMPSDLVDWPATQNWAKGHVPGAHPPGSPSSGTSPGIGEPSPAGASPGISEAAAIDKEEQAERAEQMSRTPQLMPGLLLPDQQGVWVLDTYQDHPELVELKQDSGDVNRRTGHNVLRGVLSPSGGTKQAIELEGAVSKVQLHVNDPALYVSLSTDDGAAPVAGSSALTVDTHGAGAIPAKDSVSSPTSQYVIVRVESNYKHNYRVVKTVKIGSGSAVPQTGDALSTKAEILPGKHWMKLSPREPLSIGDYALVEILSTGEVNLSVWDFRVDPQGPDNKNAIIPLDRKP
jgi:hypothetical protein